MVPVNRTLEMPYNLGTRSTKALRAENLKQLIFNGEIVEGQPSECLQL